MVYRTVRDKMTAKVKASPKGRLFIVSDFEELGSYDAVRKELGKLTNEGMLNRVHIGIYQKPNYNHFLNRVVPPSPIEIAETIARKNNWTIVPAKDLALNVLGLDNQVPNVYHFISDGPTKVIKLNKGVILHFRHVTQREILMNRTSALVIEAFKQLGEENVTDYVLNQVFSKLNTKQLNQLNKDMKYSRVWIKEKVNRIDEVLS